MVVRKRDPARTLALLWRAPEHRSRKPGLGADEIVRAGIELADAEGLAALSMRGVAERLGAGTMSLYTYVPSKEDLIDVMLDTVYGETEPAGPELTGWRAKLEHVARQNWELHRKHPWTLEIGTARPVLGPKETAKYERELRTVDGIGLTEVEMDSVLSLVLGHARTAARGAAEAADAERRTGLTDEQWWQAHAPLLDRLIDPEHFPTAAKVGTAAGSAHGAATTAAHRFEFGLARVLDGVEVLIRSRERSGS
ncbi:TetR/AcrR family transcriptional regulator [Saccharopolyspora gregorii]|uniref:TetR/AcrR family transcriptional regulator n=1 Tax=Saccharopolyspora gregorii TaxID=33914 RepID=A0ABP6RQF3_9PSEU